MTYSPKRLLTRLVAPTIEPISLSEAKPFLRVDSPDHDTLISTLISTARHMAEQYIRQSLITQTWKLSVPACQIEDANILGNHAVRLAMGPVKTITAVAAVASDGTTQVIDSEQYYLSTDREALLVNAGLVSYQLDISYTAGYGAAADIPPPIRQAILMHVAAMFDHPQDDSAHDVPPSARVLLMPYREVRL